MSEVVKIESTQLWELLELETVKRLPRSQLTALTLDNNYKQITMKIENIYAFSIAIHLQNNEHSAIVYHCKPLKDWRDNGFMCPRMGSNEYAVSHSPFLRRHCRRNSKLTRENSQLPRQGER